jgi:hypothetical protein
MGSCYPIATAISSKCAHNARYETHKLSHGLEIVNAHNRVT